MSTLITRVTALDAHGAKQGAWVHLDGPDVVAVGVGDAPDIPGADVVDGAGGYLTPGFVDLHVHGGGGAAVEDGADGIRDLVAVHRAHGTTRTLLSLASAPLTALASSLDAIRETMTSDPTILGAHLEGPFLAPRRRGAHEERHLIEPSPEAVSALITAGHGILRQVTIAPELPGAIAAIERFVAAGVRVAIGHTDASAEVARAAFDAGATILTHAFNAMPPISAREPGPLGAALADDRVTIEVIADGIHVAPANLRWLARATVGRLALVTDAMAAASAAAGRYAIGGRAVDADAAGRAVLPGSDTLAGSTLTLDRAFRVAANDAGIGPRGAIAALTRNPARALGYGERFGLLAPGYAADAVLLTESLEVEAVWADGHRAR